MLGRAHMAVGAALGLAAARLSFGVADFAATTDGAVVTGAWVLGCVAVGALAGALPDMLDARESAGREATGTSWKGIRRTVNARQASLVDKALLVPRATGAVAMDLVSGILPHRGPSHWLLAWMAVSALAYLALRAWALPLALGLALSAGYLSHLVTDGFTTAGVPFLAPLTGRRLRLLPRFLRFRGDSWAQWLVVGIVAAGGVWVWVQPWVIAAIAWAATLVQQWRP